MGVEWKPGIGDPTVWGWVTVMAYIAAAVFALKAANVAKMAGRVWKTESAFWFGVTLTMVVLGINKQLDFQSLLTELARGWAREAGWYEDRRMVQSAAIVFMVATAIGTAAGLCLLLRRAAVEVKLAAIALCFILAFVVIRAASFHGIDALIGSDFGGVSWNAILELPGILLVGFCAAAYWMKPRGKTENLQDERAN